MNLLHHHAFLMAAASRVVENAEPDLLDRWPVFTTLLLAAGLVSDAFIAANWKRRRQSSDGAPLRVGPKPWGLQELFVAAGIALAMFLSVGLVSTLLRLKMPALLALLAAAEMVLLGFLFVCLRIANVDWRNAFGLRAGTTGHALAMGAVFFLAVLPPLQVLSMLRDAVFRFFEWKITSQDIVHMLLTNGSPVLTTILFVFAIVVAPLCEETFFRGIAYPALKQRWGVFFALGVASALFAAIHFHLASFPLLFALALGLALAYEYTGSLLTPIAMHALFNLLNTALLLASRKSP